MKALIVFILLISASQSVFSLTCANLFEGRYKVLSQEEAIEYQVLALSMSFRVLENEVTTIAPYKKIRQSPSLEALYDHIKSLSPDYKKRLARKIASEIALFYSTDPKLFTYNQRRAHVSLNSVDAPIPGDLLFIEKNIDEILVRFALSNGSLSLGKFVKNVTDPIRLAGTSVSVVLTRGILSDFSTAISDPYTVAIALLGTTLTDLIKIPRKGFPRKPLNLKDGSLITRKDGRDFITFSPESPSLSLFIYN